MTRLELRTRQRWRWDTDAATAHWALGAAASLDGALLNGSNGAVSFGVADGGGVLRVRVRPQPAPFRRGASFTLTANFADGTTASATVDGAGRADDLQRGAELRRARGEPDGDGDGDELPGRGERVLRGRRHGELDDGGFVHAALGGDRDRVHGGAGSAGRDGHESRRAGGGPRGRVHGGDAAADAEPGVSGKLRDKVGQGSAAFSADGALDGSFQVTVGAGSGARTVTRLELRRRSGGTWDTDSATAHWALGAAASLDGALLNAGNGTVSFAVADGAAFVLFASDFNPTPFGSGASFAMTANFADGTTASATVTLPVVPTISSVAPSSGAPGASLTVTVTGTNFQAGASASFGAGITVSSTTVVSATQLSVALAIAPTAALGPRDVTVTIRRPDGGPRRRLHGRSAAGNDQPGVPR